MLCTDIFLHLQIHIDIPQHFSAFCQGNAASKGSWLRVLICIRMVNQLTSGLTKFPSFGWCYLGKSWVNRPLYSLCRPFKCVWFLNELTKRVTPWLDSCDCNSLKVKSLCRRPKLCLLFILYIRCIFLGGWRIVSSFKQVHHQPADGVELFKDGWGRVCTCNLGKVMRLMFAIFVDWRFQLMVNLFGLVVWDSWDPPMKGIVT